MQRFSHQEENAVSVMLACHAICHGMAMTHCLERGGEHVKPQHFRLMLDCAAICAATADLVQQKSRFHRQMCELCVEACEACAEDCERLDGMEECVSACRACAEACRDMV